MRDERDAESGEVPVGWDMSSPRVPSAAPNGLSGTELPYGRYAASSMSATRIGEILEELAFRTSHDIPPSMLTVGVRSDGDSQGTCSAVEVSEREIPESEPTRFSRVPTPPEEAAGRKGGTVPGDAWHGESSSSA